MECSVVYRHIEAVGNFFLFDTEVANNSHLVNCDPKIKTLIGLYSVGEGGKKTGDDSTCNTSDQL